jgi:hypothetical protein
MWIRQVRSRWLVPAALLCLVAQGCGEPNRAPTRGAAGSSTLAGAGGSDVGRGGDSPLGGAGSGGSLAAGGDGPVSGGVAGSAAGAGAANPTAGAGGVSGAAGTGSAAEGGETAGASGAGAASGAGGGAAGGGGAYQGKELFILFGQSNMSGFSPMPDEPWPINEQITFMVQYDCPRLNQTKDEWLPAQPPLHGCQWATNGLGLGLADYFGPALIKTWQNSEIGLIPNAIPAVTIDVFMKGGPSPGGGTKALPDGYTSAYTLMVDRTKEAQKLGRVRAILFHQGESDYNQGKAPEWLDKLASVVADLRADLGLTETIPFIAGEVPPEGNYSGQNEYEDQIPSKIPNSAVVSAEGTHVADIAHFDTESARIMGERYAAKFLELVPEP